MTPHRATETQIHGLAERDRALRSDESKIEVVVLERGQRRVEVTDDDFRFDVGIALKKCAGEMRRKVFSDALVGTQAEMAALGVADLVDRCYGLIAGESIRRA